MIEHDNFYDYYQSQTKNCSNAIACQFLKNEQKYSWTYQQINEQTSDIIKILDRHAISPHEHIAILGASSVYWVSVFLAIQAKKAVAILLDPGLNVKEQKKLLEHAEPKLLFIDPVLIHEKNQHLYDNIASYTIEKKPVCLNSQTTAGFYCQENINVACILYTSGTTGNNKGVMISHEALVRAINVGNNIAKLTPTDNVLCVLPAHHIFGLVCVLLTPLCNKACITFVERIDGQAIFAAINSFPPTIIIAVPRLLELIAQRIKENINKQPRWKKFIFNNLLALNKFLRKYLHKNYGRYLFKPIHIRLGGHLRLIISGASSLKKVTYEFLQGIGFNIIEGYGLTETCALTTANLPYQNIPGSVGSPVENVELRMSPTEQDGVNEIHIKTPTIMSGYFKDPQATTAVLSSDGWFKTHDLGYIDNLNNLFIQGRTKELINLSNGKLVMPSLLEQYYAGLPYVAEYAITGVFNPVTQNDEIHLAVVMLDEFQTTQDIEDKQNEIKQQVLKIGQQLPSWWKIAHIHFIDEIPKTTTLKVKRKLLAEILHNKPNQTSAHKIKKTASSRATHDNTTNKVISIINDLLICKDQTPIEDVNCHLQLDLSLDSLDYMELAQRITQQLQLRIDATQLATCNTIADIIVYCQTGIESNIKLSTPTMQPMLTAEEQTNIHQCWHKIANRHNASHIGVKIISSSVKLFFKIFYRVKVFNIDHLPLNQPFIICANHTSHLDNILLASLDIFSSQKIVFTGAKDYFFKNTFKRNLVSSITPVIPFERDNNPLNLARNMEFIRLAQQDKYIIVVYPEGTRSIHGKLGNFKPGAALFAAHYQLPVVPAYIEGTFQALPKGKYLPKPGTLSVIFGEPQTLLLDAETQNAYQSYQRFIKQLRDTIIELKHILGENYD
ncbi:MAG: AMP-binding protein [Gammaproteobacteria bacterium]